MAIYDDPTAALRNLDRRHAGTAGTRVFDSPQRALQWLGKAQPDGTDGGGDDGGGDDGGGETKTPKEVCDELRQQAQRDWNRVCQEVGCDGGTWTFTCTNDGRLIPGTDRDCYGCPDGSPKESLSPTSMIV